MSKHNAPKCPTCKGTGHDKGGRPEIRRVPFDVYEHNAYISGEYDQKQYHVTQKQGSGCLTCCGVGYKE